MIDCMSDLETLGTTPHAVVVSVGATFFDLVSGELGGNFYMVADVAEQIKRGREVNPDTLKWWMNQSDAAKRVFHEKAKPIKDILKLFSAWYLQNSTQKSGAYIWGNGSTFDVSILEDLMRDYELPCPWGYNRAMDLRTYKRFCANGAPVEKGGVNHNALDDAVSQAKYVLKSCKIVTTPPPPSAGPLGVKVSEVQ